MESISTLEKRKRSINSELLTIQDSLHQTEIILENSENIEKYFSKKFYPEIESGVILYLKTWKGIQKQSGAFQFYGESGQMGLGVMEKEWKREFDGLKLKFACVKNIEKEVGLKEDSRNLAFWYYFSRVKKKLGRFDANFLLDGVYDFIKVTPGSERVQFAADVASDPGDSNPLLDGLRGVSDEHYPPERAEQAGKEFINFRDELIVLSEHLKTDIQALEEDGGRLDGLIAKAGLKRLRKKWEDAIGLIDTITSLDHDEEEICGSVSKITTRVIENFSDLKVYIETEDDVKILSRLKSGLTNAIIDIRKPKREELDIPVVTGTMKYKRSQRDFVEDIRKYFEKIGKCYKGREKSLLSSYLKRNNDSSEKLMKSLDEESTHKHKKIFSDMRKLYEKQKIIVDILQKADEIHRMVVPERMSQKDPWIFVELNLRTLIFTGGIAYPDAILKHAEKNDWEEATRMTNTLLYFLTTHHSRVNREEIRNAIEYILQGKYVEFNGII